MAQIELEHHALNKAAVGRVEQVDREEALALEHGACMRQLAKALFAVVVAHARVADAAEGRVVVDDVPAPVVDRHAARVRAAQQIVALGAVVAEAVQRQRPRPLVDEGNRVVHRVVGHHRQDRAEQLFLATSMSGVTPVTMCSGICRPPRPLPAQASTLAPLARARRPAASACAGWRLVDHAGVVRGCRRVRRRSPRSGLHAGDELVDALARHQRVVGRDADLPAVGRLAVRDALRRIGHRVVARDQRRRLAAEFQRDRRQVLAAVRITILPTAGEPVKTMWLKGSEVNTWDRPAPRRPRPPGLRRRPRPSSRLSTRWWPA